MRIIHVNGQRMVFVAEQITYEQVLELAKERPGASVTWRLKGKNDGGVLHHGSPPLELGSPPLKFMDEVVFNCMMTGNA